MARLTWNAIWAKPRAAPVRRCEAPWRCCLKKTGPSGMTAKSLGISRTASFPFFANFLFLFLFLLVSVFDRFFNLG